MVAAIAARQRNEVTHPSCHAALFGRHGAPDGAEDDGEGGAAEPEADQQTEAEIDLGLTGAHGQEHKAGYVAKAPQDDDPNEAELVRDHPGQRLRQAPEEILKRHGEAEDLARDGQIARDGAHEEPKCLADAETGAHDCRPQNEDDNGVSGHFLLLRHGGVFSQMRAWQEDRRHDPPGAGSSPAVMSVDCDDGAMLDRFAYALMT
jgi:hypothetical protein